MVITYNYYYKHKYITSTEIIICSKTRRIKRSTNTCTHISNSHKPYHWELGMIGYSILKCIHYSSFSSKNLAFLSNQRTQKRARIAHLHNVTPFLSLLKPSKPISNICVEEPGGTQHSPLI